MDPLGIPLNGPTSWSVWSTMPTCVQFGVWGLGFECFSKLGRVKLRESDCSRKITPESPYKKRRANTSSSLAIVECLVFG